MVPMAGVARPIASPQAERSARAAFPASSCYCWISPTASPRVSKRNITFASTARLARNEGRERTTIRGRDRFSRGLKSRP